MNQDYLGLYILMAGPVLAGAIILALDLLNERKRRRERHRHGSAA